MRTAATISIAALAALLSGCGDAALTSLTVGADHVIRLGRTGDVAVAWGSETGIAAWVAEDEGNVQFIRVEQDGSPVSTLQTLLDAPVTPETKVRVTSVGDQFFLFAIDPQESSRLAVISNDGFASETTMLPNAISLAVAPPILAMVDSGSGTLLLGEVATDSPRIPAPVAATGLLAVGAAYDGEAGVVVGADRTGCVSALAVDRDVKLKGSTGATQCFGGQWDDATVIVWSPRTRIFAAAVGMRGTLNQGAQSTQGFAFEYQIEPSGHVTLTRATTAPTEPEGAAFFGSGDSALQLTHDKSGEIASLFDAFGHPLGGEPAIAWGPASSGSARAVTGTVGKAWIAINAVNKPGKGKSSLLSRAITEN
jgi:hypothetical protein